MAFEIKTGSYLKKRKVLLDGVEITVALPGAGDELAMSQARRRIDYLNKKIEAGTAIDADYDLYDKLEERMFALLEKFFNDGSENNAKVKEWLQRTPVAVIMTAIEDMKRQFEEKSDNTDGREALPANKA